MGDIQLYMKYNGMLKDMKNTHQYMTESKKGTQSLMKYVQDMQQ